MVLLGYEKGVSGKLLVGSGPADRQPSAVSRRPALSEKELGYGRQVARRCHAIQSKQPAYAQGFGGQPSAKVGAAAGVGWSRKRKK